MLFNCLQCGKKVSSKQDACVYCKHDNSSFITELKAAREPVGIKDTVTESLKNNLKEKYAGTFFAFLFRK